MKEYIEIERKFWYENLLYSYNKGITSVYVALLWPYGLYAMGNKYFF